MTARIDDIVQGTLRGWVWDPARPQLRLDVSLWLDGASLGVHRADRFRGDLQRAGIGDGCHGLECALPIAQQNGAEHVLELRLAETPEAEPLVRATMSLPKRAHMLRGKVERIAGGALIGWVWDRARPGDAIDLELLIDGTRCLRARADRFRRDLLDAGMGSGAHGFVFDLAHLPTPPAIGAMLHVRAVRADDHWEVGSTAFVPMPVPMPIEIAKPTSLKLNTQDLREKAKDAERRRDFAAAASLLDAGLAEAPHDFDLVFLRARVAHALSETDTAEHFARQALALRPGHLRPIVILARIARSRGRHLEAIALWEAVHPGDDAYRERLVGRAASLMALGRPLEAMAEYALAAQRDAMDGDALRGLAEASEAAGGGHAALGHWRRCAAAMPLDEVPGQRVAQLAARLAPPRAALRPLRNPDLRNWQGTVEGEAGLDAVVPAEGLMMRNLDAAGGVLRYAAADPREDFPGDLPGYGLWLQVPAGGAEVAFALVSSVVEMGLRMVLEVCLLDRATQAISWVEAILRGAQNEQVLLREEFGNRPRLLSFDLRLEPPELAPSDVWLVLRLAGPAALTLRPPRALCRLDASSGSTLGFEDPALAMWRFAADHVR